MSTFPRSDAKKKCMAHALYDNLAETPDELAFRRGDTLMVLEQNTGGLEGWWLCSLRGRQGIVPGNRLRLMPGVYDPVQAAKMAAQMHPTTGRYRRSWSPNAKISAMNQSTTSLPRGGRSDGVMRQFSGETYDSPPAPVSVVGARPQEDYDTPRSHRVPPTPPPASAKPVRSSAPALTPSGGPATYSAPRADAPSASNRCSVVSITSAGSSTRSSSGSSSNRSSLEQAPELSSLRRPPGIPENGLYDASEEYDVPRHAAPAWRTPAVEQETYDVPPTRPRPSGELSEPLQLHGGGGTYDFPQPRAGLEASTDTYDVPQPHSRPESRQGNVHPPPQATELPQDTYDVPQPHSRPESRQTNVHAPLRAAELPQDTYDFPPPRPYEERSDVYESPPPPRPHGESSAVYESPPPPRAPESQSRLRIVDDTYDIPRPPSARLSELELSDSSATRGEAETDSPNDTLDTIDTYDYPRPSEDVYDSPRALQESYSSPRPDLDIYDSPRALSETSPRRGAAPAHAHGSRDSLQSAALSHRASTVSEASVGSDSDVVLRSEHVRTGATTSRNATYWLRSAGSGGSASLSSLGEPRELPLDTEAGLETVSRLEQELNATVERLFGFVVPGWRGAAHMEACAVDLKLTVVRMRAALRELVQFAYGAMVATARGPEHKLGTQFVQVLRPLEESVKLIDTAAETQERVGWTPAALCKPQGAPADALDRLLACAQSLRGDVRQAVAFVRGNAPQIFRRRASVIPERGPSPPGGPRAGLMGDYDYVCLQTSGSLAEEGDDVRSRLPEELRGSFDNLMKESQIPVSSRVDENDHQVIEFYRGQTESHHEFLNNAIDALFQTIQNNQPPKVFVAHSKFVILSAHKLVYIGDTVHRNVMHPGVRRDALAAADALFTTLKRTVQSTKTAALQFPSAHAVQEMADAVLDVSRAAGDLKLVMDEAAF